MIVVELRFKWCTLWLPLTPQPLVWVGDPEEPACISPNLFPVYRDGNEYVDINYWICAITGRLNPQLNTHHHNKHFAASVFTLMEWCESHLYVLCCHY